MLLALPTFGQSFANFIWQLGYSSGIMGVSLASGGCFQSGGQFDTCLTYIPEPSRRGFAVSTLLWLATWSGVSWVSAGIAFAGLLSGSMVVP